MTSSQVFGQKLKTQQLILENSTPNNVTLLPATGAFTNYTLALPANAATTNNVLTVTGVVGPAVTTSWQSASGLVKAANGLSKSLGGDSVELGGTLYKPTTIALAGNNLALTGAGRLIVNGSGITLGSATDTASSFNTRGSDGSFGQILISRGTGNSPIWSSSLSGLTFNNTTLTGTTTINDGPLNVNTSVFNISGGTTTNFNNNVNFGDTVTFSILPELPLNKNQILVGDASNHAAAFGPPVADQVLISNGSGDVAWSNISSIVQARSGVEMNGGYVELGGALLDATTITTNTVGGLNLTVGGTGRFTVSASEGLRLGTTSPLYTGATQTAGTTNQLLVSQGNAASPEWSSTLTGLTFNNTTLTGTTTINDGPLNVNTSVFNISGGTTTNFNNNVNFGDTVTFSILPELPLNKNQILVGDASNHAAAFGPPVADQVLISNGSGDVAWSNISSIVQARNGLNVNGGYVELGGALTGSPTITTSAANNVTFDGGGTVTISATGNGAGAGGLTLGANTELNTGGSNGTSGQILRSNGDGASPSWVNVGTLVQASNGLNKDGDTVQLGGTLNEPTTINTQAANNLSIAGSGAFSVATTGNGAGAGGIVLGPNTDIFANGTVGATDDILVSRGDGNSPQWKSLSSIIISGRVLATNSAVTQNVPVAGKLANQKVIITLENPNTTEAVIGYQLSGNSAGGFDVTFTAVPAVGTYINYVILP
ncbi:MAG: hypothetical protein LC116_06080 [Bacteroidetes bacterium]|nr:hypothetical protein [Bacteroidota bacterium]